MHLEEKTLTSETVYEGPIFTITHDTVELENGKTAVRDVLLHHGGVCVLPVTDNNEVLLVKQLRYPFQTVTVEAPAGKLEKGQNPLENGKRELLEETGFESNDWKFLLKIPSNATMADNYANIFMAKNCRKVSGQSLDETEYLNVHIYNRKEIDDMIKSGEFAQANHVLALLLADKESNQQEAEDNE